MVKPENARKLKFKLPSAKNSEEFAKRMLYGAFPKAPKNKYFFY
jgi:hypothetical protein